MKFCLVMYSGMRVYMEYDRFIECINFLDKYHVDYKYEFDNYECFLVREISKTGGPVILDFLLRYE